ncbi:hypothetical protein NX801_26175 [Streptomyces sp. LP05-1]|uniref:Uncharacterized protein n=1 Tax=Streptomyces pyxinae TaxID=2970734 RepID=A0ABT2CNQ0_9ACTN|nr:hypothetical protein [Streptomyces sp. LP05-1]MCS0639067.1 hypothetical protein [Streptomyces sp. LP05-1]
MTEPIEPETTEERPTGLPGDTEPDTVEHQNEEASENEGDEDAAEPLDSEDALIDA